MYIQVNVTNEGKEKVGNKGKYKGISTGKAIKRLKNHDENDIAPADESCNLACFLEEASVI
jgi:hypothetical protein